MSFRRTRKNPLATARDVEPNVAAAVADQVPPAAVTATIAAAPAAVTADLESRTPALVDLGGGLGRWKLGAANGPPFSWGAAGWSALAGRPSVGVAGTVGDGTTNDRAAIVSSDSSAVAASLPLMLTPGIYRVSSNLTITSPVWFTAGAIIRPDNGVTVTFAGGIVIAPPSKIFDYSAGGKVVLKSSWVPVSAKWFGAVGDDVADDTNPLTWWGTYCALNRAQGWLPNGTYKVTAAVVLPPGPNGYALRGENLNFTVIKQYTDNVPVLQLGNSSDATRRLLPLEHIGFTYANAQPSTNTNANCIVFQGPAGSGMTSLAYSRLQFLSFSNGFYCMQLGSAGAAPWAMHFDELFMQNMSGGFYDTSNNVGGVPRNDWGTLTLYCDNAIGPIFKGLSDYNTTIGAIEFLRANNGPRLIETTSGFSADIGAIKLEVGAYAAAGSLIRFGTTHQVRIGSFKITPSDPTTFNPATGTLAIFEVASGSGAPGTSYIDVGTLDLAASAAVTGNCVAFKSGSLDVSKVRVGNVKLANGWTLQDRSASPVGDYLTVAAWVNNALSPNKGDADYTVTVGDPNVVHFNTAFTAQRTITLPSQTDNNTCASLYYELVFDGAINGSNTAVIKQGTTTLRTQTVDGRRLRYAWRRSTWVLVSVSPVSGNPITSGGSLAVGATTGFAYLPQIAGVPTGTPATETGGVPVAVDSAGQVWSYNIAGGGWRAQLQVQATLDFPSIAAQSHQDLTVTVTGVPNSVRPVALGIPTAGPTTGLIYEAWVSAANTVTVRAVNYTNAAIDPAAGTFRVAVFL